ncbi:MAG: AraC family transcriptional regulator [Bacteroidales bacterium]|nr:AraC family transcriptional regulator [Bacteroidales bacterium]
MGKILTAVTKSGSIKVLILLCLGLVALGVGVAWAIDYKELYNEYSSKSLREIKDEADSLVVYEPDRALALYSILINSYRPRMKSDAKYDVASAYNNAGYVYFFEYSDYVQAYEYFLRGIELAQEIGATPLLPAAYINMGNIHSTYNETEVATSYYRRALETAYQEQDWENMMSAAFNLISHAYFCEPQDSVRETLSLLSDPEIPQVEMLGANRRFAQSYRSYVNGDIPEAIAQMREAEDAIDARYYPERYLNLLMRNESNLYREADDYAPAIERSKQSQQLAQRMGHLDLESFSYANLSEIFADMGRKDSADFYKLKSLEISDSLFNVVKYGSIKELKASFDMRQTQQALQEMIQKRRTQLTILLIVSVALVIILAMAARLYFQNRQLRERNIELYRRIQEKLELSEPQPKEVPVAVVAVGEDKPRTSVMREDEKQRLHSAILEVFETNPEIYTQDFNIDRLAAILESKNRYVSEAINDLSGKNFNTLLAERRIQEACRRMSDPALSARLTIEAVAQDLGFKSRSNFATLFKKLTGLTPREYQKIATSQIKAQEEA